MVKVDLVCADDLELLIDDGGSEVVDCELDAEEMSVGFWGHYCWAGLRCVGVGCSDRARRHASGPKVPWNLLSRRRARQSRAVLAGSKPF